MPGPDDLGHFLANGNSNSAGFEMVSNKQGWFSLRLTCILVVLLSFHTSRCQDAQPSCSSARIGVVNGELFDCANLDSFSFIRPLLRAYPPGVAQFTFTDSPKLVLTSVDFHHMAFENLWRVQIIRCNVTKINPEPFAGLRRLRVLSIKSNNLTEISSNSFLGLEQLEVIVLKENQIASLSAGTFTNLRNLTEIDLSNNSIAYIADNMFRNQRKLNTLDLEQNEITVVNTATFKGLVQLRFLDLTSNKIGSVSVGAFTELTELSHLNLRYNNLRSLHPAIFLTNTHLQVLDLSGNNLASWANFPMNIPSLQFLTMNDCKIEYRPADYFAKLKNLYLLGLAGNEFRSFEDVSFEGLPELHFVNLDSNKFTSFNLNTFRELNPTFADNLVNYGDLSLHNNPWDCEDPVVDSMVSLCDGRGVIF